VGKGSVEKRLSSRLGSKMPASLGEVDSAVPAVLSWKQWGRACPLKKITVENYREDKYYPKVVRAVGAIQGNRCQGLLEARGISPTLLTRRDRKLQGDLAEEPTIRGRRAASDLSISVGRLTT